MFTEIQGSLCLHSCHQGAVRRMRTRIGLLVQPESMRSTIALTQREQLHSLLKWGLFSSEYAANKPTNLKQIKFSNSIS